MVQTLTVALALLLLGVANASWNSTGQVKPWRGDIDTAQSLAAALGARSYRNEVIFMSELYMESMHQAATMLQGLGLSHILIQLMDAAKCEASSRLLPDLGCCWSRMGLPPGVAGSRRMALLRAITGARIVAHGYNLLLLDGDTMVLQNPYPYLKAPPFSDVTLLAMRGVPPRSASTGTAYIQGASRSGAVAQLMEEAAVRMVQWAEYSTAKGVPKLLNDFARSSAMGCPDALVFTDALHSALLNRTLHWNCFKPSPAVAAALGIRPNRLQLAMQDWEALHAQALGLNADGFKGLFHRQVVKDGFPQALVMAKSYTVYSVKLHAQPRSNAPLKQQQEDNLLQHEIYKAALQHQDGPSVVALRKLISAERMLARKPATRELLGLAPENSAQEGHCRSCVIMNGTEREAGDTATAGSDKEPHRQHDSLESAALVGSLHSKGTQGIPSLASVLDRQQGQGLPAAVGTGMATSSTAQPGMARLSSKATGGRQMVSAPPQSATASETADSQRKGDAEVFAYAPDFLFGSWNDRGVLGYWDPGLAGSPPKQVVAHMGRAPGSGGPGWYGPRVAFNLFDWDLAHKQARLVGASTAPGSLPKLVALAPEAVSRLVAAAAELAAGADGGEGSGVGGSAVAWGRVASGMSEAEKLWLTAIRGLVQVSILTGRMFVWPDPPCNATWLNINPIPTSSPASKGTAAAQWRLPLRPNPRAVAYGSLNDLRCMPNEYLSQQCLHIFSSTWIRSPWRGTPGDVPLRGVLEAEARHVEQLAWGSSTSPGYGLRGPTPGSVVSITRGQAAHAQEEQKKAGGDEQPAALRKWWEDPEAGTGRNSLPNGMVNDASTSGDDSPESAITAALTADVLRAAGSVDAGYGSHMDGHPVVYLRQAVVVEDMPMAGTRKMMVLLSRCPVFARSSR